MIATTKLILIGLCLAAVAAVAGCGSAPKAAPKEYAFWPPAPNEPRLQYLCSFQSSASVEPTKSRLDELVYGKDIQQVQTINKPYGVAMWNGRIYVCDLRTNAVIILDLRKQQTRIIGRSGSDTFQTPSDIAIAPDGTKYVSDMGRSSIFIYDANDRYVGSIATPEMKPVGLAVYENELFVCDFKGQDVKVLDRGNGQLLRTIGSAGQAAGQFIRPLGIDTDSQGNVYVTDVLNCRMQKFDRRGNLLTAFGIASANAGGFVRPKHIAVDREGTIYVVDAAFQNVQLFDQIGRVYTYFGAAGSHPGSMYLPAGIAVHEGDLDLFEKYAHEAFALERLIVVTNQFGDNKVAVYGMGRLKPGKTVQDVAPGRLNIVAGVGEAKTRGPGAALPDNLPPEAAGVPATSATGDEPQSPQSPPAETRERK